MSGIASGRIAEIVKELQKELIGGAWQTEIGSTQMAMLAIQRYLDELAEEVDKLK